MWGFFFISIVALGFWMFNYLSYESIEVPDTAIREPRPEPSIAPPPETESEPEPEPRTMRPRIAELREYYDNHDIVGFIEVPGTSISYPVAQTGNNEFYLYHNLHWRRDNAGAIFLDYENDLYALADDNTLIYGHNMRAGTKFHNVRHFHRAEFFNANTYILLDTPYEETVWSIFSFFDTHINFCYLTTNFYDRDEFFEFILLLQQMSLHETDIVLHPSDQILILSTCASRGGDYRYVVVARLDRL